METGKGTCLIVGCGYLGLRLARYRAAQGALPGPVLALVRREASAEALLREGIPALALDLDDAATVASLPDSLIPASVVYLAPPSGQGHDDLRLACCLELLGGTRPEVLLYLSTTGVYGDTHGAPVDESSPVAPGDARGRQRLAAEGRVSNWCAERGVRGVVVRAPAIYGPQRLPLDRLRRGEPVLRPEASAPGNRIHVDDLAAACLAALARPVEGLFNVTDGQPESMAAFTTRVAGLAGLPAPPQITWAEAQGVLSPGLLAFLRESRRVETRRALELGWTPRYGDPDEGIRASLVEMGWTPLP
jgi:nucleoside-diphosphate-sugar epimerase